MLSEDGSEGEVYRMASFEHLAFIDEAVRPHRPPGPPQVVSGVENVLWSQDGVLFWNFECGDCYLSFLLVEKLCEYEVTGVSHGQQRTVEVSKPVVLNGGSIGSLRIGDPLLQIVVLVIK